MFLLVIKKVEVITAWYAMYGGNGGVQVLAGGDSAAPKL